MAILSKNTIVRFNFIFGFILNIALWLFLYWQVEPQTEPIILRSNIYFGISFIGDWWRVFFLPLVGFVILIVNFILANVLLKHKPFLTYFLMLTSTLCQIVLIIISFFAVLLNG
ncbi:MAG: hypothetical protein ABIF17_02055 [Patescibacteria group bacterium]